MSLQSAQQAETRPVLPDAAPRGTIAPLLVVLTAHARRRMFILGAAERLGIAVHLIADAGELTGLPAAAVGGLIIDDAAITDHGKALATATARFPDAPVVRLEAGARSWEAEVTAWLASNWALIG